MKHKMLPLMLTAATGANAQHVNFSAITSVSHRLDDVMEIIDTGELKTKLGETELECARNATPVNRVRLGIIWHETALNLSLPSKTAYKGYAQKSYDQLNTVAEDAKTPKDLLPFISSYRASALSLVVAETRKLKLLGKSFDLFEEAVEKYAGISPLPQFLRGSVAENLPWFFFKKHRAAKHDFADIIHRYEKDPSYADFKIMSFTYWAWANQHQGRKYRRQALTYLDKAITLDAEGKAGQAKAIALKAKLSQ